MTYEELKQNISEEVQWGIDFKGKDQGGYEKSLNKDMVESILEYIEEYLNDRDIEFPKL